MIFDALPHDVQEEIVFNTTSGANPKVDLANVSTEWLISTLVSVELDRRNAIESNIGKESSLEGMRFDAVSHSLAYQARSAMPTNFDCDLAYTTGFAASVLIDSGKTGYLVHAANLTESPGQWTCGGIPFTSLISVN